MDILRMDIGWNWLEEKMGWNAFEALTDGADITAAFEDDIAREFNEARIRAPMSRVRAAGTRSWSSPSWMRTTRGSGTRRT